MTEQKIKLMSPRGTAVWPRLNEPDRRYKPEGEYKISLRLRKDNAEHAKFLTNLQEIYDEHIKLEKAKFLTEQKGKKKPEELKIVPPPWAEVVDKDTGEETGEVDIKFAMKARVDIKGKPSFEQHPSVFDAQGKPTKVVVGGGSAVKIAATVNKWCTKLGASISLRLKAVQVLELVAPGGDASYFGFQKEDGFDGTPDEVVDSPAADGDKPAGSDEF